MKKSAKSALIGLLILTNINKISSLNSLPPLTYIENQKITLPIFKTKKAKNHNIGCAGYAIALARNKFKKNYPYEDAWNLKYFCTSLEVKDSTYFKEMIRMNIIHPGDLIGAYYPQSKENNKLDKFGNKREYTHLAIYLGLNKNSQPIFQHKRKSKIEQLSLIEFEKMFSIKEVLKESQPSQ